MDPALEAEAKKCTSLAMLRDAARRIVDFKSTALNSVAHVKIIGGYAVGSFRAYGEEISYVFCCK